MTPKLDRIQYHDPASRNYGVALPLNRVIQTKVWSYPKPLPLDQGQEGACVGFGWCAELATEPVRYEISNDYAFRYYAAARREDRAMGNVWPEGASVLAGAKVAKRAGMISEYRWAFGWSQVRDTLINKGPVVLGVNWYESMYQTDRNGVVSLEGDRIGGHCITAIGYMKDHPYAGECVVWLNSWGADYGNGGVGYVPVDVMRRLLQEGGEACIATDIRR